MTPCTGRSASSTTWPARSPTWWSTRPRRRSRSRAAAPPRTRYRALAGRTLDWSGIDVWFGDERFVPVDDPDSNEGMARAVLLDRVGPRAIHSLRGRRRHRRRRGASPTTPRSRPRRRSTWCTSASDPTGTPRRCSPDRPRSRSPTASWWRTATPCTRTRASTFTYPALARSRLVVFTVAGDDKRDAFTRIRSGDDLPAAHVTAERVLWLVDPAAHG